jgi:hypothetical protein
VVARPRVWGAVLAACMLVAGSGVAAGSTRSAVLHGTVLLAPATPVCMPRVPCMKPAGGVVLAFIRRGIVRARLTTASDGSYRVALTPGTYRVRVSHPAAMSRLTPDKVTVRAAELRRVTFYLDTGIR